MSRIGKLPIDCGEKVTVTVDGSTVTVKGPKGELKQTFAPCVTIRQEERRILVEPKGSDRFSSAIHGTVRSYFGGAERFRSFFVGDARYGACNHCQHGERGADALFEES